VRCVETGCATAQLTFCAEPESCAALAGRHLFREGFDAVRDQVSDVLLGDDAGNVVYTRDPASADDDPHDESNPGGTLDVKKRLSPGRWNSAGALCARQQSPSQIVRSARPRGPDDWVGLS
jgi:hypothetical protein